MKNECSPEFFRGIERSIGEEKARAVEAFRRGDFSARLAAEIARAAGSVRHRPVWIRRPAAYWLSGAIILAGLALFFTSVRKDAPKPRNIFEAALGRTATFSDSYLSASTPARSHPLSYQGPEAPQSPIFRAFMRIRDAEDATPPEGFPVPDSIRTPKLTIEERLDILFRRQAIWRGLLLFNEKDKETWKWPVNSSELLA